MHNWYTHFNFAFDLPDAAKAKAAADLLTEIENLTENTEFDDWPKALDDFKHFDCGVEILLSQTDRTVSIRDASGSRNLGPVARYLQEVLKRFQPDGAIAFEFAVVSPKNVEGVFGGGITMVTADNVEYKNTFDLLTAWLKEQTVDREARSNPNPEVHYLCTKCGKANVEISVPAFFRLNENWKVSTVDVEATPLSYFCNDCGEATSVHSPRKRIETSRGVKFLWPLRNKEGKFEYVMRAYTEREPICDRWYVDEEY